MLSHPPSTVVTAPLALASGAFITRTGLVFREEPSFPQFLETLDTVIAMEAMARWAMLDLIKLGRVHFGDEAVRVALQERKVEKTEIQEVLRLEPIVVRHPELTPEHHLTVAELDEVDQQRWLENAKTYDLTPRDLRASIKANEVVRYSGEQVNSKALRVRGTENYLTAITDFTAWRRKAEPTIRDWKPETIALALDDFKPIADFLDWLKARQAELAGSVNGRNGEKEAGR